MMTPSAGKAGEGANDKPAVPARAKQCRKLLLTLNSLLVLVGVAIFALGFVPKFGQGIIGPKLRSYAQGIVSEASDSGLDEIDLSTFDIGDILDNVAIVIMSVGLGLVLLSAVGMFGGKKYLLCCLLPYSAVLGLLLLAEGLVILCFCTNRAVIDSRVTPGLLRDLQAGYSGYNGTDTVSQTWTLVMIGMSCCGVNNHTDFEAATKWRRSYFQDGWYFELATPLPCCVFDTKVPDDYSCAVNPRPDTSNYNKGCYATFLGWMETYQIVIILAVTGLLLTQVVSFVSGVLLTRYLIQKRRPPDTEDNGDHGPTSRGPKPLRQQSTMDDDDSPSICHPKRHRNPGLADGLGLDLASMLLPGLMGRQQNRPMGDPLRDPNMYDYRSYMSQLLASSFGQPASQPYYAPPRGPTHAPPVPHDLLPPGTSLVRPSNSPQYLVPIAPKPPPVRMIQNQPSALTLYTHPPTYENANRYSVPSRVVSIDDAAADSHQTRQSTRRHSRRTSQNSVPSRVVSIDDAAADSHQTRQSTRRHSRTSQKHVESSSSSDSETEIDSPMPKQKSLEKQGSMESMASSTTSSSSDGI